MPDIHELDAIAQAELARDGKVSPAELGHAALARIEALDGDIGAIVGQPLEVAPASGPFAGVPIALKDAGQQLAGTPHWIGTRALHRVGWRSPATTEMTARLLRLGFRPIAKTNVPELSNGATTEPTAFGPTRNPFALDRTVGGSSGGSAAAVAAGMVPVATGGDATGSLRFPASACGVLTLKPTRGRIPAEVPAGAPDPLGAWSDFVLTRSARDLRAIFRALAGWTPPSGTSLRIGLLEGDAHPDCAEAVRRCGRALEALGHAISDDHPAALTRVLDPVRPALATLSAFECACQVAWVARTAGSLQQGDLEPRTLEEATRGRALTHRDAALAAERVRAAVAPLRSWWDDHDVLVTPVMARPPWPLGERTGPDHTGPFCAPASFTGQPAVAVPIHRTADGLPVGVQLIGTPGADETLLNLACALQEAGALA